MRTRQNQLDWVSEHQCGDCANAQQDSKWIACEKCKVWIHAKCAKIPEDIFQILVNTETCQGEPISQITLKLNPIPNPNEVSDVLTWFLEWILKTFKSSV